MIRHPNELPIEIPISEDRPKTEKKITFDFWRWGDMLKQRKKRIMAVEDVNEKNDDKGRV